MQKLLKLSIPAIFILFVNYAFAQITLYDVSKHGALNNSTTVNTKAIQTVIDECSSKGGGKVYFGPGNWLTGTLLLKDNVTLFIDSGATLRGSSDINDYQIIEPFKDGSGSTMGYCFIGAVGAKNIGIEGKGVIDGQGKQVHATGGTGKRPFLLRLVRCKKVDIKNICLINSAAWTFHLFQCVNVNVIDIKINSIGLSNNDGIDVDGSRRVTIKDCAIISGDDAICFKTTSPMPCKDITVSGISINTQQGAIKIGTESVGDFENIKVSNCQIIFSRSGGIKLFSVDGSNMKDIEISDMIMNKVNLPIMIRLGARLKTFRVADTKREIGTIKNIHIKNINVVDASSAGMLITGIPGHNIDGLSIENVSIHLHGGGTEYEAELRPEEKINAYPESDIFGKLPAYALFVRHTKNLQMTNIRITMDKSDKRPAIFAFDIENGLLKTLSLPVVDSAYPLIKLESARNVTLSAIKQSGGTSINFLGIDGTGCKHIVIDKNAIGAVLSGDGVSPKVVIKR